MSYPAVAKLAMVKSRKDRVTWLKSKLQVETDVDKGTIRIQLNEGVFLEQAVVIDAVVEAYYRQVEPHFRATQNDRLLKYQEIILRSRQEIKKHSKLAKLPVLATDPDADRSIRKTHEQRIMQAESQIIHSERSIHSMEMEKPPEPVLKVVQKATLR